MKNRVIKKIMAYLLVGAMVITTPMTASATESVLQEAYGLDQSGAGADSTGTGNVNKMDTSSGTGTSTNTSTNGVQIPGDIKDHLPEILGISLDKTAVDLDFIGDVEAVRARAVFDEYDPKDETMDWKINAEQKENIEKQINWFSEDYDIASFQSGGKQGPNAVVLGRKQGQTRICAWIEADGLSYTNAPMRPTDGDFVAWATVTVKNELIGIVFDENAVNGIPCVASKRQYDLKKYTWLDYGVTEKNEDGVDEKVYTRADKSNATLTYSITGTTAGKNEKGVDVKTVAVVTADGILKITKGAEGGTISILVVNENGKSTTGTIKLEKENPVTKMGTLSAKKLDLGFAGKSIESADPNKVKIATTLEAKVPAYNTKEKSAKTDMSADNPTTDEFIWSSNKPAIAKIAEVSDDGKTAIVEATGVGTAKITVKASSGKSAAFNVTVYATPSSIVLPEKVSAYTGKPMTLNAELRGDQDQVLPVGTTTFKWVIEKVDKTNKNGRVSKVANPYATISAKKDIATIKPKDLLKDPSTGVLPEGNKGTAKVLITLVKYKDNKTNKMVEFKGNAIRNDVTGKLEVDDKGNIKNDPNKERFTTVEITQSNIQKVFLNVYKNKVIQDENNKITLDKDESNLLITMAPKKANSSKNETWAITDKQSNAKFYVGQKYFTEAGTEDNESRDMIDSIAWTVSGKGVEYSIDGAKLTTDFTSNVKKTIKASYITLSSDKKKATKNTKTITITPIQNATSIAFAKPIVVKNPGKNPQAVTFAIKNVTPKKAVYGDITWKINVYDAGANEGRGSVESIKNATENDPIVKSIKGNKSITVLAPVTAGSVIKVGAYSATGVVAYGYVYVTEQTKKVIPGVMEDGKFIQKGTKTTEWLVLKVGEKDKLTAQLTVAGATDNKNVEIKDEKFSQLADKKENTTGRFGDTTAYITEPIVSYTLDKKGASVVKIDANGNVTPLQKGKATVTMKTLSGKSAKMTINVEPSSN